jgi:drug/metabolite transporter (DMT)-like permease
MPIAKRGWVTIMLLLAAAVLVFISIVSFAASDPEYETEDNLLGVLAGLGAVVLLGWSLVKIRGARSSAASGSSDRSTLDT